MAAAEEAILKRVLPHSLEAEQSVIGSMIMDREAIVVASEIITGEDFYNKQYGTLFETMVELNDSGRPVDLVTLQDRLREKDVPPEVSSPEFIRELRAFCDGLKPDFFLVGELLHGDYNRWVGEGMLHSATNYECYKGLHSSFNSMNLFEIMHSLKRQFGPEPWTLYRGKHLLSFVDNHDVSRIASVLQEPRHLPLIYALMFAMPGIPCIYYGSEWGAKGEKRDGDPALRVSFDAPQFNALSEWISVLARIKRQSSALCYGDFHDVLITNRQCVFARRSEEECVWTLINADSEPYLFRTGAAGKQACSLIDDARFTMEEEMVLAPYSAKLLRIEE